MLWLFLISNSLAAKRLAICNFVFKKHQLNEKSRDLTRDFYFLKS